MRKSCETCVYYQSKGEEGQCRHDPPVVIAVTDQQHSHARAVTKPLTVFPYVDPKRDWCGYHYEGGEDATGE